MPVGWAPVDQQQIRAGGRQFPNTFGANMESADWPWPVFGPQRVSWQLLASLSRPTSQRWVDCRGGTEERGRANQGLAGARWSTAQLRSAAPGAAPENPRGLPRAQSHSDPGCAPFGNRGGARGECFGTRRARVYGAHAPDTPSGNGRVEGALGH